MLKPKYLNYELRDSSRLVQPKPRTTNFGLRSFSYLASKLWNDLPNDMKSLTDTNINQFKHQVKQWDGPNYDFISSFYV